MTKITGGADCAARREAGPVDWDGLTTEQRNAAKGVCEILGNLAKQPWKPPKARRGVDLFLPPIDRERHNHVVLIDGGRGSGKTALLITLLDAWSWNVRGGEEEQHKPHEKLKKLMEGTEHVVPVGLVDLQPLPESTNLLIHLVGQLQRLIEAIEQHHQAPHEQMRERSPWHSLGGEELKSPKQWRKFLQAAAAGWDGSLANRRANLDPEAYADELEQAERNRLDVITSFRTLIDVVIEEIGGLYKRAKNETPLFVIAVDDADMNPARSLDLLDLVRTLWHPRVAFLLTGESDLFRRMLRARALCALRAPLGSLSVLPEEVSEIQAKGKITELAGAMYDKAIPRRHRCELPLLSPSERFRLLKPDLGKVTAFAHPLRLTTLAEYFEIQKQARLLLPARLRSVLDFRQDIQALTTRAQQDHQDDVNALLWNLCHDSEADDSTEDHKGKSKTNGTTGTRWAVEDDDSVSDREDGSPRERLKLLAHEYVGWTLIPAGRTTRLFERGNVLLESSTTFSATCQDDNTVSNKKVATWIVAADAVTNYAWRDLNGRGFFVRSIMRRMSYSWPLPPSGSFLDFATLSFCWKHVVENAVRAGGWKSSGDLARAYLATVLGCQDMRLKRSTFTVNEAAPQLTQELISLAQQVWQTTPSWEQLAERVTGMSNDWPSHAALLAAPEMGLTHEEANAWLKALKSKLGSRWTDILRAMRKERQRGTLIAMGRAGLEDESEDSRVSQHMEALDEELGSFAWQAELSSHRRAYSASMFVETLKSFPVDSVAPHSNSNTYLTIADYLIPSRLSLLTKTASAALLKRWSDVLNDLRGNEGVVPLALTMLWNEAIKMGEASNLKPLRHQVDVAFLRKMYDDAQRGGRAWNYLDQGKSNNLATSLRVKEAAFRWREETGFLDSLSGVLFELAWDVMVDAADNESVSQMLYRDWWDAAGGSRDAMRALFPWPAVSWPSFLDYELLAEAWNKTLPITLGIENTLSGDRRAGDDLAYFYIRLVNDIAESRSTDTKWVHNASKKQWGRTISDYKNHLSRHDGSRWAAYQNWFGRMRLLAAPESGLSSQLSEWILDAFDPSEEEKDVLRRTRRERLRDLNVGAEQVERELKRIDDDNDNHPWVARIEKRSAQPPKGGPNTDRKQG